MKITEELDAGPVMKKIKLILIFDTSRISEKLSKISSEYCRSFR